MGSVLPERGTPNRWRYRSGWWFILPLGLSIATWWLWRTRQPDLPTEDANLPGAVLLLGEPEEIRSLLKQGTARSFANRPLLAAVLPAKYLNGRPQRLGRVPVVGSVDNIAEIVRITGAVTLILAGAEAEQQLEELRMTLAATPVELLIASQKVSLAGLLGQRGLSCHG